MPIKLAISTLNLANSQYTDILVVFKLVNAEVSVTRPQRTFLNQKNACLVEAVTATNSIKAINILFDLTRDLKSVQCSFIQNKKNQPSSGTRSKILIQVFVHCLFVLLPLSFTGHNYMATFNLKRVLLIVPFTNKCTLK